ncbi:hypothetical protein [Paracoccus mutanolyticus]|nr:hypothetical protein [Paracoccus mutanolyticus]
MAQEGPGATGGTPIVMLGDGTYMMMNSDIYSASDESARFLTRA